MNKSSDAYKETRKEIKNQLIELQNKLSHLDESQQRNSNNWGYVGTANEIKNKLNELVKFI